MPEALVELRQDPLRRGADPAATTTFEEDRGPCVPNENWPHWRQPAARYDEAHRFGQRPFVLISFTFAVLLIQSPTPDSLTLEAALARARAIRGQAAVAVARVAEARAAFRAAGAVENPIGAYSYTQDTPRQHISVDQPLDWLIRRSADRASAHAALERARFDSVQVMADLSADVRRAFYGAIASAQALRLSGEQAALADSLAVLAGRRLAHGDISEFERDQVALDAARAKQLVSRARETDRFARAELGRQVGWSQDQALPVLVGELQEGLPNLPSSARVEADSLPLVRTAVAESLSTAWKLTSIRRSRIPIPSVTLGADWDDPSQPGRTLSVIGLAIPLPLWNQRGAEVAIADAQARQASAAAREARAESARRLASARARLEEVAERARSLKEELLPAAIRLRERATLAYREGETGVLPVLDALRAERELTASEIEELLALQLAIADWNSLVGVAQ